LNERARIPNSPPALDIYSGYFVSFQNQRNALDLAAIGSGNKQSRREGGRRRIPAGVPREESLIRFSARREDTPTSPAYFTQSFQRQRPTTFIISKFPVSKVEQRRMGIALPQAAEGRGGAEFSVAGIHREDRARPRGRGGVEG